MFTRKFQPFCLLCFGNNEQNVTTSFVILPIGLIYKKKSSKTKTPAGTVKRSEVIALPTKIPKP